MSMPPQDNPFEIPPVVSYPSLGAYGGSSYGYSIGGVRNPNDDMSQQRMFLDQVERVKKLEQALVSARDTIVKLKEEVEQLSSEPLTAAVFEKWVSPEDPEKAPSSAFVIAQGTRHKVSVRPSIEKGTNKLVPGTVVLINTAYTVVEIFGKETTGDVYTFQELHGKFRAIVTDSADVSSSLVVRLSNELSRTKLATGDRLLVSTRTMFAYELLPKKETQDLLLEKVPDVSYSDIGGLSKQVQEIQDAIELPYLRADLFKAYNLSAPKGVLLYGAPGNGKTLIAKAVASSLAQQCGGNAYFINIKGPELLNKWVGETEHKIREIFEQARSKADEGHPVVVFFDEMESLFRVRGSGVSSDMESTIVPQLLSEIDGVDGLSNVIIIGASNRPDLIDPAVLRPGRLDIKIAIERPDKEAAEDIFTIYFNDSVPVHAGEPDQASIISRLVERVYDASAENEFLEVTYQKGDKETLYFRDFVSGAMIANIVARAKKLAIKEEIATGERGVREDHLMSAVRQEFEQNEDLPNTTNPDDWARISGRKGERIANVRSIVQERGKRDKEEVVKTTGQYL